MPSIQVLLLRLLMVIIIGGMIGVERELKSKSAGFRTIMMICIGSFLFTTFSIYISPQTPDRIASNIVTGIGFLGAGVIFKNNNRVVGLTTAATIWITAALGMGVATGQYLFVSIASLTAILSLHFLERMEGWIDKKNQYRTYRITTKNEGNILMNSETSFRSYNLSSKRELVSREGNEVMFSWIVKGSEKDHYNFINNLLKDDNVIKFEMI